MSARKEVSSLRNFSKSLASSASIVSCFQIVGSHHGDKSFLYLIVREVQQEGVPSQVDIFDGQVSALENHGQRFLYIRFVVEELAGVIIFAGQFI